MRYTLSLTLLSTLAVATAPAQESTRPAGRTISGTVRFQGKPVAAASVRILSSDSAPTTTDAQGRFTLAWPDESFSWHRELFARDSHGRLGWLDVSWTGDPRFFDPGLRIDLHDIAEASGRLTDATGVPLRQAKVRVLHLEVGDPERGRTYGVPPELADAMTAVTADDGRFTLKGVPTGSGMFADVTAPGFGRPQLWWKQGVPCDVSLEKAGSIRLRFEGAADPTKLAGLKFYPNRKLVPGATAVNVAQRTEIVADGTLPQTIRDIVPGRYTLQSWNDGQTPYLADLSSEFTVPPGGVGEVTVKVTPAAEVRGRVIDAKTRKGIARVTVGIAASMEGGGRAIVNSAKSDADGRFRAFVKPGEISVGVFASYSRPEGYLREAMDREPVTAAVGAGQSHTFPGIVLEPTVPVEGVVVDAAGKPLPGVSVLTAHEVLSHPPSAPVTDATGRFRVTGLGADDTTALRARTPTATTAGAVMVNVKELKGPVKLVLSEVNACRIRGRVVDPDDKPVADAAAGVGWVCRGVGRSALYGTSASGGAFRTDADGRFETLALWPDEDYTVLVRADGFGKVESAKVRGAAGQVYDLGTIIMPRTSGSVAGVVVDGSGKPVLGVRVFNEGDGPKPVTTTTGSDGRFRLEGLFGGQVYVFARKEGHRFTAVRTKSGEANLRITLLAADAPPPRGQPDPRPAEYVAAQKKLVRHLLDQLWALPDDKLSGFRSRVLEGTARLDLEQAHRWFAERRQRGEPGTDEKSPLARVLRIAEAEHAAVTDPDETLGLLAPLTADQAYPVLLALGRQFRATDPAKSLRFAEEAAVKARALPLPDRAWSLADVGDLVVQLNQRDAGRKLIVEAAELAETLGTDGRQGYARGRVAVQVVRFDLDRARALVLQNETRESNRWQAAIAVRFAADDPKQALKMVDAIQDDRSSLKGDTRRRVAVRLAETGQVPEAVKLAESSSNDQFRPMTAIVAVAAVAGEKDPTLARSLIDRALNVYVENSDRIMSVHQSRGMFAAWTAYQARRAGHPDMQSVVGRVLACRPTTSYDSPDRIAQAHAEIAMVLALADPITAQRLLEQAIPPNRPVPGGLRDRREWLFAVAFADPQRGIAEIDRLIGQAKKSQDGINGTGLSELLSIVMQPTETELVRALCLYAGTSALPRDDED